jgi:MFS family permease
MSHHRHSPSITSRLFPSTDLSAFISILAARVFYAVNWFNVAAIFPLLILDFEKHDIGLLGSISAAFFIGVGLFQVPAGILAARYSARTAAIFGIALSSSAALLCGFITDEFQLILLRFVVGAGMAFFFSSGIVLIAKHAVAIGNSGVSSRTCDKKKSPGFAIGLMNAAHSGGGILGLFGWIVIAQMFGWRTSLVLGGAIGIATALLMIISIPLLSSSSSSSSSSSTSRSGPQDTTEEKTRSADAKDNVTAEPKNDSNGSSDDNKNKNNNKNDSYSESRREEDPDVFDYSPSSSAAEGQSGHADGSRRWPPVSEVWAVLSNPRLVALGLVLTGVQASWALLLTFAVVYLQSLNVQLEGTGIIASMTLVSAIVSAPLIGGFYDRMKVKDSRKILLLCGVGISVALAAMSIQILSVIIIAIIAIGFFSGGAFTVVYAKARAIRVPVRGIDHGDDENNDNDNDNDDEKGAFYNSSALNVAWVNGLSLIGVLWMPLAFSLAVRDDGGVGGGGYPNAWLLSAVLAALFVFLPLKRVGK